MNKVILMGRLTRDPEVRYSQNDTSMAIARYSLAVDRRFARRNEGSNEQTVDFINCVAFGKSAEFAESAGFVASADAKHKALYHRALISTTYPVRGVIGLPSSVAFIHVIGTSLPSIFKSPLSSRVRFGCCPCRM